jgi:hypothetical protein
MSKEVIEVDGESVGTGESAVFVSIRKYELELVSSPSCQDASEAVMMTCWRCPEG